MVGTYRHIQLELDLSSPFKCQGLSQWIVCLKFPRVHHSWQILLCSISAVLSTLIIVEMEIFCWCQETPSIMLVPNSKVPNPKYTNTKQYQYHNIFIFLYIYIYTLYIRIYSYVLNRCHVIMLSNSLISSFQYKISNSLLSQRRSQPAA